MNCLIFNCQGVANYPYPACTMTHGVKLRDIKQGLKDYQDGLPLSNWYTGHGPGKLTLEEIEHYSKII